jgi:hypothetical protein
LNCAIQVELWPEQAHALLLRQLTLLEKTGKKERLKQTRALVSQLG